VNYNELLANAHVYVGSHCHACIECDGKACRNEIPGPGAKGTGDTAIRNYDSWKNIRLNMDTIHDNIPIDTSVNLFGVNLKYPFFAGPVGAVNLHYGPKYDDMSYNRILVSACSQSGILAFTGDGTNPDVMTNSVKAISECGGRGIPTIKPWNMTTVSNKINEAIKSGAVAIAMDIDAAGLPFLKNTIPPAGPKSEEELKMIISQSPVPFIVKGIMTVKGAIKAANAGAYAIVVSNHGGRVLDQCPSTAEVLPEISEAVKGKVKILVDGGIRSGADIFKAIALGADSVLICRPFVTAVYGGAEEGVSFYISKLADELKDVMEMCGAVNINEITRDMIRQ
jgi:isopentenyl diphosphate isomerase/L-lactate dehydrogenase-like FMN-dependent dehydrogenase